MQNPSFELTRTRLGKDGPWVGSQGLGCMGMSEFYGVTDTAEASATLARALSLGVTLFDTADMYGLGANESFLAPFVRANRDRVVIATKFGYTRTPEHPDDWSLCNRPEYIRAAVDRSLQRLGVDVIDLYYMHRRAPDVPLQESVGAMAELVAAGKVRALGLCEVSATELREAHAIHPIAALQSEWSVFSRHIEDEVVPTAVSLGVTLVPYAPLGRGLLTGQAFSTTLSPDDSRQHFPRFQPGNRAANARLVAALDAMATARGVSSAQLALAWLQQKAAQMHATIVPIPGTRRRTRLEENVAATAIRLDADTMAALEPLAESVQGVAI
ncbi:aldo/keto reductase [Piscinibacter gummiphilus]|uniref:Aldo/keto reductase n=1 Tax=Piscinibacter gummiphilus TaxID=946333 RepID=A0A1W6L8X3_9BURK|nr:aldo/keto reductase [Piscinibacter gummiphilus]ARN20650.1 aldo/keto reductase [Piscinibacter gummiphilus]ATU65327.1 aldo/keto reductase [Piscinibacter gummiphilus]GLS94469.1 aldo/keto reductase [Piscinibacter gummiphilus]